MALKLNKTDNNVNATPENQNFVKKVDAPEGRKMFQNKAANRALIVAGAVIGVAILACIVLLLIPIG